MFSRFEVTNCTAVGTIEVVTEDGVQTWEPGQVGQQGKLWTGTWPRLRPAPPPRLYVVDGQPVELHEGTGPFLPPSLRVLRGGRE